MAVADANSGGYFAQISLASYRVKLNDINESFVEFLWPFSCNGLLHLNFDNDWFADLWIGTRRAEMDRRAVQTAAPP